MFGWKPSRVGSNTNCYLHQPLPSTALSNVFRHWMASMLLLGTYSHRHMTCPPRQALLQAPLHTSSQSELGDLAPHTFIYAKPMWPHVSPAFKSYCLPIMLFVYRQVVNWPCQNRMTLMIQFTVPKMFWLNKIAWQIYINSSTKHDRQYHKTDVE